MRNRLAILLLIGLALPFLDKPVHVDDANFLAMARSAAAHPWTPHNFSINWGGVTQPAFDVLSNPPGIALWLAPVASKSVLWQHLWMLPWLLLAGIGAARLGERVAKRSAESVILICGAPIAVLATHALTPDLPLLACTLLGFSGLLDEDKPIAHRLGWALVLGFGAWFRYSALALIPVVFVWPWIHGQKREAFKLTGAALTPILALMIHDQLAYGDIHLFAMLGFQSTSNGGGELFHKAVASIATLGGAAALPILAFSRPRMACLGACMGAAIGFIAADWAGHSGAAAMATIGFTAAGGAALAATMRNRDPLDRILLLWLALGALFLLGLRFTASRYWIPFFAPAILIPLRTAAGSVVRISCLIAPILALVLAIDDVDMAATQERAAKRAASAGTGHFTGHWGFQHHLMERGWVPVEDDETLAPGTWIATSSIAWPQSEANDCWDFRELIPMGDPRPGLRVHTKTGGANIHGHMLAGMPPIRVFAPWSVGEDAMDHLILRRTCPYEWTEVSTPSESPNHSQTDMQHHGGPATADPSRLESAP